MDRKILLLVGGAICIVIVAVALFSFGIPGVLAKGTVIVTLKDEETGKPVGRVDGGYVRVVLGGLDQGYLTDYGELKIEGVEAGSHELMLVVPSYGEIRRFIDVASGQTVPVSIEVDMPNPIFEVAMQVSVTGNGWWQNIFGDAEAGQIKVQLTNRGDADSVGTSVLVIVYKQDDLSTPIATKMLDFPSMVPRNRGGETVTREYSCGEFVYGPGEVVAAVVFDGWPFTPKNEHISSQVSVPSSMLGELTYSVQAYLTNHPDIVINTIAKIVIAWMG